MLMVGAVPWLGHGVSLELSRLAGMCRLLTDKVRKVPCLVVVGDGRIAVVPGSVNVMAGVGGEPVQDPVPHAP